MNHYHYPQWKIINIDHELNHFNNIQNGYHIKTNINQQQLSQSTPKITPRVFSQPASANKPQHHNLTTPFSQAYNYYSNNNPTYHHYNSYHHHYNNSNQIKCKIPIQINYIIHTFHQILTLKEHHTNHYNRSKVHIHLNLDSKYIDINIHIYHQIHTLATLYPIISISIIIIIRIFRKTTNPFNHK